MNRLCLLTVTWSEDEPHFALLRASIERSRLAGLPHFVVVQTEDLPLFRRYEGDDVRLIPSRDILPAAVEEERLRARRMQQRFGRHVTRISGSLCRTLGKPAWPRYTGWHTQQLVKLAFAGNSDFETVAVLDSDVLVTPHARQDDFLAAGRIACFHKPARAAQLRGKVANWNRQAHRLFSLPYGDDSLAESYFDTPFVFDAAAVRHMMDWLEARHQTVWWRVMLSQPVRRWSEFASYRVFLKAHVQDDNIEWRSDENMRYIFDVSDSGRLATELERALGDPAVHYITLHSQSSGRRLWRPEEYLGDVRRTLERASGVS